MEKRYNEKAWDIELSAEEVKNFGWCGGQVVKRAHANYKDTFKPNETMTYQELLEDAYQARCHADVLTSQLDAARRLIKEKTAEIEQLTSQLEDIPKELEKKKEYIKNLSEQIISRDRRVAYLTTLNQNLYDKTLEKDHRIMQLEEDIEELKYMATAHQRLLEDVRKMHEIFGPEEDGNIVEKCTRLKDKLTQQQEIERSQSGVIKELDAQIDECEADKKRMDFLDNNKITVDLWRPGAVWNGVVMKGIYIDVLDDDRGFINCANVETFRAGVDELMGDGKGDSACQTY